MPPILSIYLLALLLLCLSSACYGFIFRWGKGQGGKKIFDPSKLIYYILHFTYYILRIKCICIYVVILISIYPSLLNSYISTSLLHLYPHASLSLYLYLPIHIYTYLSINQSINQSIYLSILSYLSIPLSHPILSI